MLEMVEPLLFLFKHLGLRLGHANLLHTCCHSWPSTRKKKHGFSNFSEHTLRGLGTSLGASGDPVHEREGRGHMGSDQVHEGEGNIREGEGTISVHDACESEEALLCEALLKRNKFIFVTELVGDQAGCDQPSGEAGLLFLGERAGQTVVARPPCG